MTRPPRSDKTVNDGGISLYDSVIQQAELFVRVKNIGVPEEYILDLMRMPFMYATSPDKAPAALAPDFEENN